MGSALAQAFVDVHARATTFGKELSTQLATGSKAAEAEGEEAGTSFGSGFKTKAMALMNAAGKVGGLALLAGFALAIDEGSKLEDSQVALQRAIQNTGGTWKQYAPQIATAGKQMELYGFTQSQTDQALTTMTTATGSAKQAMELLGTAANLAAFKHMDLTSAANMLAKASGGAARGLKDLGITSVAGATWAKADATANKDLADQVQSLGGMSQFAAAKHMTLATAQKLMGEAAAGSVPAMNKLGLDILPSSATAAQRLSELVTIMNAKIGGQAADAANTTEGKYKALKAQFIDVAAQIGAKLLPVVSKVIDWLVKSHMLIPLVVAVIGALTAAFVAATIAAMSFATALTGGIALAVIVMAAIIIRYHTAIWNFIKKVWHDITAWAMDAFNWVKDHWPLILGILTGPIGLAVVMIIKYWHQIVDGVSQVISDVTGWFRRLPGMIIGALGDFGNLLYNAGAAIIRGLLRGITSAAGAVKNAVGGIAHDVASFFGLSPALQGPLAGSGAPEVRGQHFGKSLAAGMASTLPNVRSASQGLAGAAGGLGGLAVAGRSAGSGGGWLEARLEVAPGAPGFIAELMQSAKLWIRDNGGGTKNSVQVALGATH